MTAPNFRNIAAYDGTQDRAFEELAFQLLTGDLDLTDAVLIRTGDPDGGLEWFLERSNGDVEGWQVKYTFDVASMLSGMTASVKTACSTRPKLTKMTFVIPRNLPDGQTAGRTSARQKYRNKVQSWRKSVAHADRVDFSLVGASELLENLAKPENSGRQTFFWGDSVLRSADLERLHDAAAVVAGPRYRPDLQIDIPIQATIDALALDDGFVTRVRQRVVEVEKSCERLTPPVAALEPETRDATVCVTDVVDAVCSANFLAATMDDDLDLIHKAVERATAALGSLERAAHIRAGKESGPAAEVLESARHNASRVGSVLYGLRRQLEGSVAAAIRGKPYFLTGDAGSGKTHLLMDACARALSEGRPAAVLFGEAFGPTDVFSQISALLDLPSGLHQSEVLGVLDACGQASGHRFVLAIDALNETSPNSTWRSALPRLEAAIRGYPHVALVVSVRSTYVESIDPGDRRNREWMNHRHPGLTGREDEAVVIYFEHYGLQSPRHPILTPEFTNPLFLQLYCQAFENRPDVAHDHVSRIDVFERFVEDRVERVVAPMQTLGSTSERQSLSADAHHVLESLVHEMAQTGSERITLSRARAIVAGLPLAPGRGEEIMNRMESEGLLASESMYIEESLQPGVRLPFQAFGDYLVLSFRLAELDDTAQLASDTPFKSWLADASWGIQEAAAVVLPELYGTEIRDLLEGEISLAVAVEEDAAYSLTRLDQLTLRTLAYRRASSVTDATHAAVDRCFADDSLTSRDLYSQLAAVASVPGHPLNAETLHRYLMRLPLADRDADFGVATYFALDDGDTFWRLAEWARRGPYPDYEDSVVELATVPLVWLLSSPNRYQRDWLTKVLVSLFVGHPDVLASHLQRFREVDDPYITERLAAVVYGVLMRSRRDQHERLDHLVDVTAECFLVNPPANALLLDHVQGAMEFAHRFGIREKSTLPNYELPFGFSRPDYPRKKSFIDSTFGSASAPGDGPRPYGGVYGSLFGLADFGRYCVDNCFGRFSTVPLSDPVPVIERPVGRLNKRQLRRVIRETDPAVRQRADAMGDELKALMSDPEVWDFFARVRECTVYPKVKDLGYPTERARRWVFMKVIKLGWTPDRFFDFERGWLRSYDRSGSQQERFGKKYQWIAYHELLARVRDNFRPMPSIAVDAASEYEGLWSAYDRDIDPSVRAIADFRMLGAHGEADLGSATGGPSVDLSGLTDPELGRYIGTAVEAGADESSFPEASDVLLTVDGEGRQWVLLSGFGETRVEDADMEFGMSLDQASIVDSWLVAETNAAASAQAIVDAGAGLHDPGDGLINTAGHTDCCYVGEIGWRNQGCYHASFDPVVSSGFEYTLTCEDYLWESGRFDASIVDSGLLTCPSAALFELGSLEWNGDAGWINGDGELVISDIGTHGFRGIHGLAARADWLSVVMRSAGFALAVRCWTERRDFRPDRARFSERSSAAVLRYDGTILSSESVHRVDRR